MFSKDGGYPQVMVDEIDKKSKIEGQPWSRLPVMTDEMKKSLIGSADFLALNYYTSRLITPSSETSNEPSFDGDVGVDYFVDGSWTKGKSDWLYNVPKGLYDLLNWINVKYDNPDVLITENGFSDDGGLNDTTRVEYLKGHLAHVSKAIDDGCNIKGFTVWSIIDNFEWTSGYTERFGVYAVNFDSSRKERTPKNSAQFMKLLIAERNFTCY